MARNLVVLFALSSLATQGSAASAQETMSYGEGEYLNSCAACHGLHGKGDGALATVLKTKPADITLLKKRYGGEFPFEQIREIIDGRKIVPSHGTREMPIWGRQFVEEDARTYGPVGGEMLTQDRIDALARYLVTLQR
ncbi:c-type cytochrome [Pseudaminobacter sp. 19-2017]|uniref:C-type cytochrome n=1 Tax=Pseudaminobacter soli (ex Zhang et al. 2022) TaxID=2831468 RepID=A0A942E5I8_9HYPH|nr:c-type cytochrome [Pseudaminobacter soli]MBS3651595.1 c-type cytochrome [Pseudaminobacter soli]